MTDFVTYVNGKPTVVTITGLGSDHHAGITETLSGESFEIEARRISFTPKYEKQAGFIKHSGFIKGSG